MFGKPNQKRGDRETPNSFTADTEPVHEAGNIEPGASKDRGSKDRGSKDREGRLQEGEGTS